jgi:hypothetical protein
MMSTGLLETRREVKYIHWKKVRQVGYLLELYRDARSTKYKIPLRPLAVRFSRITTAVPL